MQELGLLTSRRAYKLLCMRHAHVPDTLGFNSITYYYIWSACMIISPPLKMSQSNP